MPKQLPNNPELSGSPAAMQLEEQLLPDLKGDLPPPATNLENDSSDGQYDPMAAPTSSVQSEGDSSGVTEDSEPAVEKPTAQEPSVNGTISGETNGSTLAVVERPEDVSATFLAYYWPYMLFAGILACLVLSKLLSKGDPSFERQSINRKPTDPLENPTGQFKKSERFLKPKRKEEPVEQVVDKIEDASKIKDESLEGEAGNVRLADPEVIKGKPTNIQQADTMQTDQPGDEEFDFNLNDEGADSDVFSFEDAVEIDEAVEDKVKDSSSKRFKTEADVEASGIKTDELDLEDDEFVAFDDQDSQLSLADSDAEFGFDLDDDEPNNFLDSGNLAAEVLPETSSVADDDLGDLGLDEIASDALDAGGDDIDLADVQEASQEAVEAAGPEGGSVAAAGVAAAATVAGAAAVAKKGGFFSRMFGSKNKKNASDAPIEDSPVPDDVGSASSLEVAAESGGQADQIANDSGDLGDSDVLDASDMIEDSTDSFGFDESEVGQANPVASLDSGDDLGDSDVLDVSDMVDDPTDSFGFGESEVGQANPVASLDSDDDFDFDLEVDDDTDGPSVDASSDDAEELVLNDSDLDGSDLDDSSELQIDLEDLDADSTSEADLKVSEAPVIPVEQDDDLVTSEPLSSSGEVELDPDSSEADDSGELLFDLENSDELGVSANDVELTVDDASEAFAVQPTLENDEPLTEEVAATADQNDSGDFGLGVFEDAPVESVAAEASDADAETSIAAPAVAAATAVGAGIAGLAFAGTGSSDGTDSGIDKKMQAKLNTLESQNQELNSQVGDLKQQLDDVVKKNTQADKLQVQLDESQKQQKTLTETVDSLTSERDQLLKEKDSIVSDNKRLEEELAATKELHSTWEQEKADLLKQHEELAAEKEAVATKLESAVDKQEASTSELASLKTEITAFSDERSALESQVKELETKLAAAEAKPATAESGSDEDVEDLRKRFKLRLASEHRKRKEAQRQVDEAESQRNEVAKLLRAAKAEILELKTQHDNDDFEIAD